MDPDITCKLKYYFDVWTQVLRIYSSITLIYGPKRVLHRCMDPGSITLLYILKYYLDIYEPRKVLLQRMGPRKYCSDAWTQVLLRRIWTQESITSTYGPKKVLLRRMDSSIAEWAFTGSTCEYLRVWGPQSESQYLTPQLRCRHLWHRRIINT